jgi:hypothetical protein
MAISKSNFIVVYRLGDLDSADFAAYYAAKYEMDITTADPSGNSGTLNGVSWEVNGQLVGVQCSNSEILNTEADFNEQVLDPVKYAMDNAPELSGRNIWGIVLGYRVPGGFQSGDNIISSTSRMSRINSSFDRKIGNKLYNRSVFKRFDSDDANIALICSRLDGPNIQQVKTYVDNAEILSQQLFANGTFYIDPYSDKVGPSGEAYQELLLEFYNDLLPRLNLETWSTTFMDPYLDVAIPYVNNDSFVWSWFTDRAYSSYFQNTNGIRVFFYNADFDGGYTVRDENGHRWPFLSMSAGNYVASAGAMSNPSIPGFLNPISFFNSLLRGSTIGEAYLFSLPYLDWTMTLFGDPLPLCSFPSVVVPDENEIEEHECWDRMAKSLARSAAHLNKKASEIGEIINGIADLTSTDKDVELDLLYPSDTFRKFYTEDILYGQLSSLTQTLFDYPRKKYQYAGLTTTSPSINDYLTEKGFKVSRILLNVFGGAEIDSANLFDEGWWQFEFSVQDKTTSFVHYHFILEVSAEADFSTILHTKNSYGIRNWTYETSKDNFVPMVFSGVSSSYIGRRVRYESRQDALLGIDEYLTRGETYYFRVTPYNAETSEQYGDDIYSDIIYT